MEKLLQEKRRIKNSYLLLLFVATLFSGCTKDTPSNVLTFRCSESSVLGLRNYSVDFYAKRNSTSTYLISNFHKYSYDGEYDVTAQITGEKIEITPKSFNPEVRILSGSGTVNADLSHINLTYIVQNSISNETIQYEVVYTR